MEHSPEDPRFHTAPFDSALYAHPNNEPKYQAVLVRARSFAIVQGRTVSWVLARDKSEELSRLDSDKRREKAIRFWQRHDMDTKGIPGLLPLVEGLPTRLTET